jgi:molybdenum cofactor biosynthesis enzyme MoaA
MKFSLLSLVAGNMSCNARCPFCIAHMTPSQGITRAKNIIDWNNFHKSCQLANRHGTQTVMITGKGEPTLFPQEISDYLTELVEYDFPFVELQTNGILFTTQRERYEAYLRQWRERGLTTIAISVVHYLSEMNRRIYTPQASHYIDLPELIEFLHSFGFTVRLATIMLGSYIDSLSELQNLIKFARTNDVEQLAIRPVNLSKEGGTLEMRSWITEHRIDQSRLTEIGEWLDENATLLYRYSHGATVYDVDGQNLCVTNSLTVNTAPSEVRQLIFFPNGTLAYDWDHRGAVLLRGAFVGSEGVSVLRRIV